MSGQRNCDGEGRWQTNGTNKGSATPRATSGAARTPYSAMRPEWSGTRAAGLSPAARPGRVRGLDMRTTPQATIRARQDILAAGADGKHGREPGRERVCQ